MLVAQIALLQIAVALAEPAPPYALVLGVAQDAGHPQAGCARDCCAKAFENASAGHRVASLGLVDPASGARWLVEATPDLPRQLRTLQGASPPHARLDGVLVTHAHVGHYLGLAHLGREAMGASGVPVWAMPRMAAFLRANGPWAQLVELGNIEVRTLALGMSVAVGERLTATPRVVPHRDEYSETVGFVIRGPSQALLWLPDIDKWERWDVPIEELVAGVGVAYVDGTFYADGEVPGRSMAEIPHPFVSETMDRLQGLPDPVRARVRFIHLNHTNPALDAESEAAQHVRERGFGVAAEGERFEL